jgi:hypothetical protein
MFGTKHQISQKWRRWRAFSRGYVDFISDLNFGSEHQIQQSKCTAWVKVGAVPRFAGSSHRGAEGSDGSRRRA